MKPVTELRSYLADFSARCRGASWFGALFHVGVVQSITADVEKEQRKVAELGQRAARDDRAAAAILRETLADGEVTTDELPALRRALRLVESSESADLSVFRAMQPEGT